MNYIDIVSAISSGKYDFSELGDDTAVLTSLNDSKIISLNILGTAVISTLLNADEGDHENSLKQLAERHADKFDVSESMVQSDIASFLSGLRQHIK